MLNDIRSKSMVRILVSILFLQFSSISFAQERPDSPSNSPCSGRCGTNREAVDCNEDLEFEPNTGTVYHMRSGNPFTGVCEACYFNGTRQHCASFRDGKEDGVSMTWYEDSTMMLQRMHTNGVETGTWHYWYPGKKRGEQGKLSWEMHYAEGELNGTCTWYWEDGTEKKVENYNLGVLDGVKKVWEKPGYLQKEVNYVDGKLDGPFKTFFENEQPEIEMNYKKGMEDGEVKYYYDNGQLSLEGEFKMGKRIGKWTAYFSTGVDAAIENYNNDGQLDGMMYEYYEDGGKLKREAFYAQDQLIIEQKYDEFGNAVDEFGNRMDPSEAIDVQAEAANFDAGDLKKRRNRQESFDFDSLDKEFICECIRMEQAGEPETDECIKEKGKFRKAMENARKKDQKKLRKMIEDCMK